MADFVCENEKINEIKYEINATYNLTLWCKQSIIVMSSNFSVVFTPFTYWMLDVGSWKETETKRKRKNEMKWKRRQCAESEKLKCWRKMHFLVEKL